MLRSEISKIARRMVGTPFHAQGRLPGVGLDCIGVIVSVARELGLPHTDVAAYPMRPNGMLQPILDAQMVRVYREPREGDALLMTFGGAPHHVAVVVDGNQIVHAYVTVRKCVAQNLTDYWRKKVCAVYEFPGVE